MSKHSKHQTEAFKAEAVALVKTSGKGEPEIAEGLGINARTLYTWVASDKSSSAVTDEGNERDLEAENRHLHRRTRPGVSGAATLSGVGSGRERLLWVVQATSEWATASGCSLGGGNPDDLPAEPGNVWQSMGTC